jgi:hypothetical protein
VIASVALIADEHVLLVGAALLARLALLALRALPLELDERGERERLAGRLA